MKLCGRANIMSLDEALKRLKDLEDRLGSGIEPAPRESPLLQKSAAPEERVEPRPQGRVPAGLEEIVNQWQAVLNALRSKKISVASFLLEGRPVAIEDGCLVIGFPGEFKFHKDALEDNGDNKKLIEEALRDVVNTDYRIKFILNDSGVKVDTRYGQNEKSKKLDPVITDAIDVFDGEVISRDKTSPKGKV